MTRDKKSKTETESMDRAVVIYLYNIDIINIYSPQRCRHELLQSFEVPGYKS